MVIRRDCKKYGEIEPTKAVPSLVTAATIFGQ
jgi:hypothetical protein